MAEIDYDSLDDEEDQKLLFEEVARACGCNIKDLLVTHEDMFNDSVYYSGSGNINARDFLNSYRPNGTLCGSFEMNGNSLKGFYFSYGTDPAQFGLQFDGSMSERTLKGLIFVAPDCSGRAFSKPARKFKSNLGGAWG